MPRKPPWVIGDTIFHTAAGDTNFHTADGDTIVHTAVGDTIVDMALARCMQAKLTLKIAGDAQGRRRRSRSQATLTVASRGAVAHSEADHPQKLKVKYIQALIS